MTIDDWLWGDESHIQRQQKTKNYLKYRYNLDDNSTLRKYRFTCFALYTLHEAINFAEDWTIHWEHLPWLTIWGWYLLGLYLAIVTYQHWKHDIKGEPLDEDSSSPWLYWKIVTGLFEISLIYEFMITIVFWILLAPYMGPDDWHWKEYTMHGAGLAFLLGDFALNNILIESRHWVF